jgi:2-hydroxychromene-2-carboxylate isomerase
VNGADQPVFFYDLGSPTCYLVAEAVSSVLPTVPEWEPVAAAELTGADPGLEYVGRVEAHARELGLQPLRWPPNWPTNTSLSMLAATYAKRVGRGVAFSLAAFRQAFAGGRDLADMDTVLIAAAACEMHPAALLKGIELRSVADALQDATARAQRVGVRSLPAVLIEGRVYGGDELIDRARRTVSGRT